MTEKRQWTDDQKKAITSDSDNILVSAGAGSGKTAVMTERIIRKLTDPDSDNDISRMIIVTYTKSAAAELKERIGTALKSAIAADPRNQKLRRQYLLLGNARISTIHSFCLDIINRNFQKLGLSPKLRTLEGTQACLMREQIADTVISNYYDALPGYDNINNFIDFADNFITLTDTSLTQILTSTYESLSSMPAGIDFLLQSAEVYRKIASEGIGGSAYGNILFGYIDSSARFYRDKFESFLLLITASEELNEKYSGKVCSYLNYLSELIVSSAKQSVDGVLSVQNMSFGSVGRKTLSGTYDWLPQFDLLCKKFKSFSDSIKEIINCSPDIIKRDALRCADLLEKLFLFVSAFEKRYSYEKRLRGLIDFSDMERYAYKLLVNPDGTPTDIADAISDDCDEIYIDEYQDVNEIQDAIFSVFGRKCKRFMVGDIKQSIYGFRGAEPLIFSGYRSDSSVERINLNKNFRCDIPIINFANTVCGKLFENAGTVFKYDAGDNLISGKQDPGNEPVEVGIFCFEDLGRSNPPIVCEASYIAERIEKMISQGYKPGDFCILVRNKADFNVFTDELAKRSIPCTGQSQRTIFQNPEILLMLSLLNVIDNPTRDVYLAAALKSPVFNFSLSELIKIRRFKGDGSLYDAVCAYSGDDSDTNDAIIIGKCNFFLNKLALYRKYSNEPVNKLISFIYSDSGIAALCSMNETASRASGIKNNLNILYDIACNFENGTFKSLYEFNIYIDDMMRSASSFAEPPENFSDRDSVSVMTIHKSKGLEFPVVFLAEAADTFSKAELRQINYNRHVGITLKLSDKTGLASYRPIFFNIQTLANKRTEIEEEMRIMYVALTRPKKKLIITASIKNSDKTLSEMKCLADFSGKNDREMYLSVNNYLSWIFMTAGDKLNYKLIYPDKSGCKDMQNDILINAGDESANGFEIENTKYDKENIERLIEEYRKRFTFEYPAKKAASLPAKLSVSELYPAVLDEYDDSLRLTEQNSADFKIPKFLSGSKASAADKGTATHCFMQFCSFKRIAEQGVDAEIAYLLDKGFIDVHTSQLIERNNVKKFIGTELFDSILNSDFVKRELRFNVRLNASSFTLDPVNSSFLQNEFILVQGIIDCVFTDRNNRLTILDYKTDHIPHELKNKNGDAEIMLINRHRLQLSYYYAACEYMMCRKPDRVLIYSFDLGREIDIPLNIISPNGNIPNY